MVEKPDPMGKGERGFDVEEEVANIEIPSVLPVLPLRGLVIFPGQIHPFLVSRSASLKLIEDLPGAKSIIALTTQKNPEEENPQPEGLFPRGTAVRVLKLLKYPDRSIRVLVQGLARVELLEFVQREPYFTARVGRLADQAPSGREVDALQAHVASKFSKYVSLVSYLPDELQVMAMNISDPGQLADLVA